GAGAGDRGDAIPIALGAAVACGLFLYFLGIGSRSGDVFSTLLGARTTSLAVLAGAAWFARVPLRHPPMTLALVALIGAADLSASGLFAFATHHGLLAIVSVLGSLYPIVTVLLAHLLLGERITSIQRVGVVCALAGVG